MRVRKLKWADDYLKDQQDIIQNPAEYAGKWKELLGCDSLHVEIGSGKGDYWKAMSELYPESGWIGIEKNTSVAALALKKVEGDPQKNRRFIVADAADIETWFNEGEVDVIHLNFSDPWPKRRNSKRRLSHSSFLDKYKRMLSEDGCIIMKTDNSSLFEFSLLELQNNHFHLEEVYLNYRQTEHSEDAITEYEGKFMSKGNPIYRAIWKKGV